MCIRDRVYTVEEIARMLAISLRSAYNLCNSTTEFRVLRVGGSTVSYTHLDVYKRQGIGCGLAYVSAVCQVAVVILLGVLILNDMIPLEMCIRDRPWHSCRASPC